MLTQSLYQNKIHIPPTEKIQNIIYKMCFRRYLSNFYAPGLTDHLMGVVVTCLRLLPDLAFPFRQMEAKAKMASLGHRMQPPGDDCDISVTHQMVTPGCQVPSPMMSYSPATTQSMMLSSLSISSTLTLWLFSSLRWYFKKFKRWNKRPKILSYETPNIPRYKSSYKIMDKKLENNQCI